MKRTILALAAILTLGGCGSTCDDLGTVTLYWRFAGATGRIAGTFDADNPGTQLDETGCADAVVDEVRVTLGGVTDTVPCDGLNGVPGLLFTGVSRGTYDFAVEAVRAGEVVFRASGTTPAGTCGNTPVDVTLQAVSPATMLVYYDFQGVPPTSCFAAGQIVSDVAYEVRDAQNRTRETTCSGTDGSGACIAHAPNACNAPTAAFYTLSALPLAPYSFAYVDALNPLGQTVLSGCGQQVQHDGFPVLVNLGTLGACSFSPPSGLVSAAPPSL